MAFGMNINYKTHPVLKKIEKGYLSPMTIFQKDIGDLSFSIIEDSFPLWANEFKDVTYVSDSFIKASSKASKQLLLLHDDIVENDISHIHIKGTFLMGNQVFCVSHNWGKQKKETFFLWLTPNGQPLGFRLSQNGHVILWVSNVVGLQDHEKSEYVKHIWVNTIAVSMFKSYAQVETKYVKRNTRITNKTESYFNDTNFDITYLTSKWFTNLVRSEGFKVSGHFRLQPKKVNGEWTKELIWIEPYEKHGYTSRAQILNQ